MNQKTSKRQLAKRAVRMVLPVAAASQGIPMDTEAQLELMRHRLIHRLPKSRLKRLLQP